MRVKLYDQVKKLLETYPALRDSDKKLVWKIWSDAGITIGGYIKFYDFLEATGYDSISRARRMVQRRCPELRSTLPIRIAKKVKEMEKGTHVFRETVDIKPVQERLV